MKKIALLLLLCVPLLGMGGTLGTRHTSRGTTYDTGKRSVLGAPVSTSVDQQSITDLIVGAFVGLVPDLIRLCDLAWVSATQVTIGLGTNEATITATGEGIFIHNFTGLKTCDISTAGVGGRDSSTSLSPNTLYDVYTIIDSSVSKADPVLTAFECLITNHGLPPIYPAGGYDAERRVGSIRTDGSSNIIEFVQKGTYRDRWVCYGASQNVLSLGGATASTPVSLLGVTPSSTQAVRLAGRYVPIGASTEAYVATIDATSTGDRQGWIRGETASAVYVDAFDVMVSGNQIEYAVTAGADTLDLDVLCYLDML